MSQMICTGNAFNITEFVELRRFPHSVKILVKWDDTIENKRVLSNDRQYDDGEEYKYNSQGWDPRLLTGEVLSYVSLPGNRIRVQWANSWLNILFLKKQLPTNQFNILYDNLLKKTHGK